MTNCLVTPKGAVINSIGTTHEQTCKIRLKENLNRFLERGGIRVKANGDEIAIEYYKKPTLAQKTELQQMLRANDFYAVILAFQSIRKFRPIRNFNMDKIRG